ncbi:hypothetical protein BDW22DRAFT_1459714, partial [Trametopsis cervina]
DVLNSSGKKQATATQDSLDKTDAVRPIAWLRRHYHHRIVQKLAYPLYMMRSSKELVQAIRDIIETIFQAYKEGGLLHRDISAGNVMLDENYQAILNDWDHAVQLTSTGPAHVFRTGTWQFISINLLQDPMKRHSLLDDIESCFWILLFMSVHYFKHDSPNFKIGMFEERAYELHKNGTHHWFGGDAKSTFLSRRHLRTLQFECQPLNTVVHKFGTLLSDFYHTLDMAESSEMSKKMHEEVRDKLETDTVVLDFFDKALAARDWPNNDVLPDQFPPQTESEIEKQVVLNHQTANEFMAGTGHTMEEQVQMRRQARSEPQGLGTSRNAIPASGPSSRPQPLRRVAPINSGALDIPQQPVHGGPLMFPTGAAEGNMRSIDSVQSTGSKRGRLQEADEEDMVEGTSDGRVKRSRTRVRREPMQKIYQTRSRTKSDEREKEKKEFRKPIAQSQRVTRSMTRSASRK